MQYTKTNLKAFSLVELMVVIAIIGVLSAIAVPSYKTYIVKSKIVEMISITNAVQSRIVDMYNEGNTAWATGTGLTNLGFGAMTTTNVASVTAQASNIGTNNAPCSGTLSKPGGTGTGGTYIGSIVITSTTTIGLPSAAAIAIAKVGCAVGDVITWTCAPRVGTSATNIGYLPAACRIFGSTYTMLGVGTSGL